MVRRLTDDTDARQARALTDCTWPEARIERLELLRDGLIEARAKGIRAVGFGDDRIEYRSDGELAAALASVDAEIAKLEQHASRRTFYPLTSKGTL